MLLRRPVLRSSTKDELARPLRNQRRRCQAARLYVRLLPRPTIQQTPGRRDP